MSAADGIRRDAAGSDGTTRDRVARSQKNTSLLLRRAREVGLNNVAEYAGVSDTLASRWFSENAEALGKSLAFMRLKLLPEEVACVRSLEELERIMWLASVGAETLAQRGIDWMRAPDDLLFEDPE